MNDKLASVAEQLRSIADELENLESEDNAEEQDEADSSPSKPSKGSEKIGSAVAAMSKYLK